MVSEKQRKTFLSYSRANKDFAIRLTKELKSEGFDVWLDILDIPAGSRWDREGEKALRESEIFMIILTPASVESENVLDEIGYAIDNGKHILPVLLESCDVPLRLRRFQYVDFSNKSFDEGIESAKQLLSDLTAQMTIPRKTVVADGQGESVHKVKADRKEKAIPIATMLTKAKAKQDFIASLSKRPVLKGLIYGIGAIVVLMIVGIVLSALATLRNKESTTSTPTTLAVDLVIETSAQTPTFAISDTINISVFGQTGSIGILVSPNGKSQDLVNGIFNISKGSRIVIVQNGARIFLADGTSLYMSSGTIFIFTSIQNELELTMNQGSIVAKLDNGSVPLTIKTEEGFVAKISDSDSIMGVEYSLDPLGTFVDCYAGYCTISKGPNSQLILDGENSSIFYASSGIVSQSDQLQRCQFWEKAIDEQMVQRLGYCTEQQPVATSTPTISFTPTVRPTIWVNVEATQSCLNWLKDHHNKTTCP